jgi:hypothetical protein
MDHELSGTVSKDRLQAMIEAMISVAIDSVPLLPHHHGKHSINKDRIQDYIYKLAKQRTTARNNIVEAFIGTGTEITQPLFVRKF